VKSEAEDKFQETEAGILVPKDVPKTESGILVPEGLVTPAQEATGAVSRRSWRRGKVRVPPANQEASEALRKAKRRKAQKQAKKARKRNR
jgi:hypothetical protein